MTSDYPDPDLPSCQHSGSKPRLRGVWIWHHSAPSLFYPSSAPFPAFVPADLSQPNSCAGGSIWAERSQISQRKRIALPHVAPVHAWLALTRFIFPFGSHCNSASRPLILLSLGNGEEGGSFPHRQHICPCLLIIASEILKACNLVWKNGVTWHFANDSKCMEAQGARVLGGLMYSWQVWGNILKTCY